MHAQIKNLEKWLMEFLHKLYSEFARKSKISNAKLQLISFSTLFFAITFLSSILAKCVRDESCR